jgi:flagella synthesis protein FlgN
LLREEQQMLIRGETDDLASFVEPKNKYLLESARLGEKRRQVLRDRGLTPDRAGMERLLREQSNGASQLMAGWRQLLELTQTAHQINATNGTLIATRLNNTQQALSILFSTARVPGAYAADGSTVNYRSTQHLAVA